MCKTFLSRELLHYTNIHKSASQTTYVKTKHYKSIQLLICLDIFSKIFLRFFYSILNFYVEQLHSIALACLSRWRTNEESLIALVFGTVGVQSIKAHN